MRRRLGLTFLAVLALVSTAFSAPAAPRKPPIPDFTFIHCSDIHVPAGVTMRRPAPDGSMWGSGEVVAQIRTLTAPIELKPYGLTVPPPSFAIATGDLTEFGGGSGWWEQYQALWSGSPFPVYDITGNHDNTWAAGRYRIRALHGGAYYSFDKFGCHFIAIDSASVQDPRPSFGQEEILWLREDLKRVDKSTPVFVFCHHPIDGNEFASLYERDRLLDELRPWNLAAILMGHGHRPLHQVTAGVDQVMGGSTFGDAPGYSVISVKDGVLRVAYRTAWDTGTMKPLLEKPLAARSTYPLLRFAAPAEGGTVHGTTVRVRLTSDRLMNTARWEADDEKGREGELKNSRLGWLGEIDTHDWEPGAHYLRVTLTDADGTSYQRTTRFYTEGPETRVRWRAFMGGSGKGTPTVAGDLVLGGAQDGLLYAFGRKSGKQRWTFKTGGEILAQPLVAGETVYFGSGDGSFYAVDRKGNRRWSVPIGYPAYSPAVAADGKIVVAANNGHIYAFDPGSGEQRWECKEPGYAIESRPFVSGGTIYYGAWDGYVYAVNLADGSVRWKHQGAGAAASAPGVARYYSPADAGPVVAGGKVWIADRMYRLTLLNADTGDLIGEEKNVSSVALSEDGTAVYLRGTDGQLRKLSADGQPLWSAPAKTSFLPSAPAERGGVVYSNSATGRVVALDAKDGHPLWEYQAIPRLYVFSDPAPADGVVYVTGMDGSLTALEGR